MGAGEGDGRDGCGGANGRDVGGLLGLGCGVGVVLLLVVGTVRRLLVSSAVGVVCLTTCGGLVSACNKGVSC